MMLHMSSSYNLCFPCRFTRNALSQLQLPVLTRFSSNALMIQSLIRHKDAILKAVASEDFVQAAVKAAKKAPRDTPSEEGVHPALAEAEELLQEGDSLFNKASCPSELSGRFAGVWKNVNSAEFWAALQVCFYAFLAQSLCVCTSVNKCTYLGEYAAGVLGHEPCSIGVHNCAGFRLCNTIGCSSCLADNVHRRKAVLDKEVS
jgi:hypothetical protein